MNKKWTDQEYVVRFILSILVLVICGAVSYEGGYCRSENDRYREAGLAEVTVEMDERHATYMSSGQRVVEIGMLSRESAQPERETVSAQAQGEAVSARAGGEVLSAQAQGEAVSEQAEGETLPAWAEGEALPARARGEAVPEQAQKEAVPAQTEGITLSAQDYETLLRIVQAEAGNEDIKGRILVANVVLNRVSDERFPDSVQEVVFQRAGGRAQFSPVANGTYYSVVVSEDTKEAVDRALAGEDYSEGALYFAARQYAGSSQMRWFDECLTKLFVYGGHEFFTG